MSLEYPRVNSILDPFQNVLKFQIENESMNHHFTEKQVSLPASDLS